MTFLGVGESICAVGCLVFGADGPVNLLNAVRVDAFFAGESAAIGSVSDGKVFVNMKPALRHTATSAFKGLKNTGRSIRRRPASF